MVQLLYHLIYVSIMDTLFHFIILINWSLGLPNSVTFLQLRATTQNLTFISKFLFLNSFNLFPVSYFKTLSVNSLIFLNQQK